MIDKASFPGGEFPRDKQGMVQAFKQDIDFWGNGQRRLFHHITPSLIKFLEENTSIFSDPSDVVNWCDIGCGGGYVLEGIQASAEAKGHTVCVHGVDISPDAIQHCQRQWETGIFRVCDVDTYKPAPENRMPWCFAGVVSFIEVLYCFENYRRTFNDIYSEIRPGTVIVVSDASIRHHRRVYPKSIPDCAFLGAWSDHTMPIVAANAKQTSRFIKYVVYRKLS